VALARSRLVTDSIAAGTLKRIGNVALPSRGSYYLVTSSRRPKATGVVDFSRWLSGSTDA
jgi:LysR family transcriptional regulator, glycine cleavage system transcriptional activator